MHGEVQVQPVSSEWSLSLRLRELAREWRRPLLLDWIFDRSDCMAHASWVLTQSLRGQSPSKVISSLQMEAENGRQWRFGEKDGHPESFWTSWGLQTLFPSPSCLPQVVPLPRSSAPPNLTGRGLSSVLRLKPRPCSESEPLPCTLVLPSVHT